MSRAILMTETPLKFEKLRPQNSEWDDFMTSQDHHFFQTSVWGDILERGYQTQTACFVLKRGGRIVLALSGVLFDFKIFKIYHASTPYGGFAGDYSLIPAFLEHLSCFLKKDNVDMLRITQNANQLYPELKDFRSTSAYQHVIDISSSTGPASENFQKKAHRNLRKAEREGLVVRPINNSTDIEVYYRMYVLAMKRLKTVRPHTRRLYEEIYTRLISKNLGTLFFAEHNQKTIAGILLLYDRNTVYFLGSAFLPEAHALRPNDFLMAHAIEHAQDQGFAYFDFMTTGASQIGLVQYKEKWGAVSKPFLVHEKYLNPMKGRAWNFLWKAVQHPAAAYLVNAIQSE